MKLNRIAAILPTIIQLLLFSGVTVAQDFPSSTVRILVPVAAGGPLDLTARLLADHFAGAWRQSVIVENRPGSATLVAARALAQAESSGHTLLLGTSSLSSYSAFVKDPKVDVKKDFAFVSIVARVPQFVAVSAAEKFTSMSDLVAAARSKPDGLNYGSFGNASRIMTELVNQALGVKLVNVAYSGAAPASQALLRGDVSVVLDAMSTLKPLLDNGKVRVLAVAEPVRVPSFPTIPTLRDLGYSLPNFGVWYGLVAPAGTSREIVEKVSREVAAFSKTPRAKTTLEGMGFVVTSSTPEEFRQTALKGEELFLETSKSLGIAPE